MARTGRCHPDTPYSPSPIYNIRGMGTGGHVVHNDAEYLAAIAF
jgi:hypothetical protein